VRGENHPPTPMGKLAMNVAAAVQVVGTVFAFFGEYLVGMVGLPRTPLVEQVLDNKLQILGFSFLFNSIAQTVSKTDAFEVYVNGELVFSKLEKQRMPTIDEIFAALAERGVALPNDSGLTKQAVRNRQM